MKLDTRAGTKGQKLAEDRHHADFINKNYRQRTDRTDRKSGDPKQKLNDTLVQPILRLWRTPTSPSRLTS